MKVFTRRLFSVLLFVSLFAQINNAQPATLVFKNAAVIDVTSGGVKRDMTVVAAKGKIVAVGKTARMKTPPNAQIIDARGKFLIPGLWDMHIHIDDAGAWAFPLLVANGVVGVRDLGSHVDRLAEWREMQKQNALMPQVLAAGPLVSGKIGDPDPRMVLVGTPEEAERAVAMIAEKGADMVKVHDWILPEAYFALIAEAKKRGLSVVGHQPVSLAARQVSDAGQKSIEHFGSAFGGFMIDVSSDEAMLRRDAQSLIPLTAPEFNPVRLFEKQGDDWERRLADSYSPAKAKNLADVFRRNRTWITPTIQSFAFNVAFLTDADAVRDPRLKYFPASLQKLARDAAANAALPSAAKTEGKRRLYEKQLEFVRVLDRAGVGLLAGTDAVPYPVTFYGFSLHDELEKMVAAGLSPLAALRTTTLNPAKYFGTTNETGGIAIGKRADLVLLDADPLENIQNTRKIDAVVLRGKYLDRAALDRILRDVQTSNDKK